MRTAGLELHYVVVRPSKPVAVGRAQARGDVDLSTDGPVETMFEAFQELGHYEAHVVDSTALSVPDTVQLILDRFPAGDFPVDPGHRKTRRL